LVGPSDLPVPADHRHPEGAPVENRFQRFICPEQLLFGLPEQFDSFFELFVPDVYGAPPMGSKFFYRIRSSKKNTTAADVLATKKQTGA
jgi:hypothetical protein